MEGRRIDRRAPAGPAPGRRVTAPSPRAAAGALLGLALGAGTLPLHAQNPIEGYDWSARTLRPSGQPIIPAFEGWYQEDDGSYRLCFGYWSGNIEAEVDIPHGPDNFIEPAEFDGVQPTHFMPVPRTGYRKHYCVFTVRIPEDHAGRDVVWTLRLGGSEFSAPGRVTAPAYMLDEPDSLSRAAAWGFLRRGGGDRELRRDHRGGPWDLARLQPGASAGIDRPASPLDRARGRPRGGDGPGSGRAP